MRIEEEIRHGQGWDHEWHRLRVNLLYSAGWLTHLARDFLAPFEITPKQFNILRILRLDHPAEIPVLEVRERMIDRMSDVSRLIDRLSQKGLVAKRPCAEDKRSQRVKITPAGLDLLAQVDAQMVELDRVVQRLSAEEAHTLNHLLNKMRGD